MLDSTVLRNALAAAGPSCLPCAWASGHELLQALLPKSPFIAFFLKVSSQPRLPVYTNPLFLLRDPGGS